MRLACAAIALLLTALPATAFQPETDSVLTRVKAGKPVKISDIATLMRDSERWCYRESDGKCAWSDIYLSVDADGASYEISNAWDADTTISLVDHGAFRDDRFICETGYDWVASVYASHSADNSVIRGRDLQAIKNQLDPMRGSATLRCYDYVFLSTDAAAQTVTLRQRTHDGDTMLADDDVEVTLHFDPSDAAALTWNW